MESVHPPSPSVKASPPWPPTSPPTSPPSTPDGSRPPTTRTLPERIVELTFLDPTQRGAALAPWKIAPLELWKAVDSLADSPTDTDHSLRRLTDPNSTISVQSIAASPRSARKIVAVLNADKTLAAAVAADHAAIVAWKQAALAVSHSTPNAGVDLVEWLLQNNSLVVLNNLAVHRAATRFRNAQVDFNSTPIRHLMLTYLALCLRSSQPGLIHHAGALNDLLREVAESPLDQRFHLPQLDAISTITAPPDELIDRAALRRWLTAPVTSGPFPISRLFAFVHRHQVDLTEKFSDLGQERFRIGLWKWAESFGSSIEVGAGLPPWATRPPAPLPVASPSANVVRVRTKAVRVVGYFEAALGLGEAARLCVRSLELIGESIETVSYRHLVSDVVPWVALKRDGQPAADVELICISAADLPRWSQVDPPIRGAQPYRVGLWFWESTTLSPTMINGFSHVNEVWTTSPFTYDAVRAAAPPHVAVQLMPFGVSLDSDPGTAPPVGSRSARDRVANWLPPLSELTERRWAGFSFDLASRIERKNPFGLIDAWTSAYPEPDNATLIIKTMNGAVHGKVLDQLRRATANRPDIAIVNAAWSPAQHHQFVRALSTYVSLHRSEGYGLVLLEAMAQGVPVIATGASGNLAFMNETNSWLIPASPVQLQSADGIYGRHDTMFEPDVTAAARAIRAVLTPTLEEEADKATRVMSALSDTATLADGSAAAKWMARRLFEIRNRN